MQIGPRAHMVWTREINGKSFRFTRTESIYYGTREVTLKVEDRDPFFGVWQGEFRGVYRHQFRFSRRAGE